MPNKQGFTDWTYRTFHPDKYPVINNPNAMFPHQRFVRDFLQYNSPYRGLVLFHQLGTGKTATSIAAAEGFIDNHQRVIVMIPASLQTNYRNEVIKYASVGQPSKKIWAFLDVSKSGQFLSTSFIRKLKLSGDNRTVAYPMSMIPDDLPDPAIVRKNVSWRSMTDAEHIQAMDVIQYIIDTKYLFINYNGVTSRSAALQEFNNTIVSKNTFVIIDEAHNFISRVVNGSQLTVAKQMYQKIMDADAKVVMLTGTPIINHPYELSRMINLVRGPIHIDVYTLLKDGVMPKSLDDIYLELESAGLSDTIDEVILDPGNKVIKVVMKSPNTAPVHTFLMKKYKVGKRVGSEKSYALPITKEEFVASFIDESDPENPTVKNMDVFQRRINGTVSYLKTIGEQYFPTVYPRRIEAIPMSDYQFNTYSKVRHKEREMDKNNKRGARAAPAGVLNDKGSVYRAFSRMACNFVFPEGIERPFPNDLRALMKRELEAVEGDDSDKEPEGSNAPDVARMYDVAITKALRELEESAEQHLTGPAMKKHCSPKYAKVLADIHSSPGKVLLYSQFRTVEGLGVMKIILKNAGYKEIILETQNGQLTIANASDILDPKYDGKRFITFSGDDREKVKTLLELFNSTPSTPAELPQPLKEILGETRHNLRGEFIKLIMITQSGAEGISLKCVRRVLILEPFWNMVRLEQVVGRAVRALSHIDLPLEERFVTVSIYTSVFTKEMLKNFTIQTKDFGLTSDQHILQIAERKDKVIQTFLNLLKAMSVDCRNNAAVNKLTSQGMRCYAFPINYNPDDFAYHAYMNQDMATQNTNITKKRQLQGRVVAERGTGKKYVLIPEYPGKRFDYVAYKDAGVLVEMGV
jgi:superfamily II DNA or RNA helicase